MSGATHAYAAFRTCGHPVALCVDDPDYLKETASFVAQSVRDGYTLERVTIERAREIGVVYCHCVPGPDHAKAVAREKARRTRRRR